MPDTISAKDYIKRFESAKKRKSNWVSYLKIAYRYFCPLRETFDSHHEGEHKHNEIFDSTGEQALNRFASRVQAALIPPWRRWSKLTAGNAVPEDQQDNVNEKLEKASDILFRHFNHSALATAVNEAIVDMGISTGALIFQEGDGINEPIFDIQSVPTSELVLEEGPKGTVETVWREFEVVARNIKRRWSDATIGAELDEIIKNNPDKKVPIVEGTVYNDDTKKYEYKVIWNRARDKQYVVERDMDSSPWIVFRWSKVAGEVYGRGPALSALADVLTLNKVKEFTLKNAAMALSGIYTALDDGVLNPWTIELIPNTIIPVRSNDNRNPSLRAVERSGDFNVSALIIEDLRQAINDALFNDRLGPVEGPTKSATEISIRNQELVQDSGASFGRMQTELIERLIARGVAILQGRGELPRFKIDGEEVTLQHESPLARAQDQDELIGIRQYIEIVGLFGEETLAAATKLDELPTEVGKRTAMPMSLIRNEAEREKFNDDAKAAAAAVAGGAQVPAGAQVAGGAI